MAALGAALELARADVMTAEQRAAESRHTLQRAELELEGCVGRAEQLRLVERDLGAEVDRLGEEAEALSLRLKALAEERRAKGTLLEAIRRDFAALQARAQAEEAALDELRVRLRGAREAAETLRHDQVGLAGHRTELGQILGALDERQEHLHRRLDRLKAERVEADAERARIEAARGVASARVSAAAARVAALEVELRDLATDAGAAAAERTAATEAAETCRVTLASRRSSRAALEELEAQRAGYARGVQAVFAAAGEARLRGVVGTVADLLDVPRELERAVEAALGERLQWVVMETFEAAKTALGYLGRSGGGQATFLPLDWLNGTPEAHVGTDPGVVGLAEALVASGHPRLVANLLGSVVVVRDLGAAERLYAQNGHGASFVTVGGELLSPPGALGGGRAAGGGDASLLARKRAIRDLGAEILRLELEVEEAQERGRRAEARVAALDDTQRARATAREAAEAERLTASKDLEQVVREAERVGLAAEALRTEVAQLRADAAGVETEARTQRQGLAEVEARAARVAAEIAELLGRIEIDSQDEARRSQAFLDAQVELAALAGRIDTIESDLVRNQADEGEAEERIQAGEERLATLRGRLEEGSAERRRLDARAEAVRAERDQIEAVARVTAETVRERTEAVTRAADDLRGSEAELHRATRAVQEHAIRLAELRVRRQDLEADVRRRFEVEPDGLRLAHDPERDLEEARARLEAVAQRIAALEPVNLIADEEYRELDERLAFLRTQHDDLSSSMQRPGEGASRDDADRAGAVPRGVRGHQPALPGPLHAALRGRACRAAPGRGAGGRRPARDRHRDGRSAAGQAAPGGLAHVGRREGADRPRAALRDLLLPAESLLPARRGGRAARRREHPPVHAGPPGAVEPDPVHRDHPQPEDDGGRRRALRRHHGGAGALPARLRQPHLTRRRAGAGRPCPSWPLRVRARRSSGSSSPRPGWKTR